MEPLKKTDLRPGLQLGEWTLLDGPLLRNNARQSKWAWSCQCSCGKERLVEEWTLRYGNSKRCRSCARRMRYRENPNRTVASAAVSALRSRMTELQPEALGELQQLVADEVARRACG
jgi:hypothetical protein